MASPSQSSISRINELHESISVKGGGASFFDYEKALVIDILDDTGYNDVTGGFESSVSDLCRCSHITTGQGANLLDTSDIMCTHPIESLIKRGLQIMPLKNYNVLNETAIGSRDGMGPFP